MINAKRRRLTITNTVRTARMESKRGRFPHARAARNGKYTERNERG